MSPDQFIRKVCHDMRAPLRAMQEIPHWLREDLAQHLSPLPDEVVELFDMLEGQAARLDGIVVGLADLANVKRTADKATTPTADLDIPSQIVAQIECKQLPIERAHLEMVCAHLMDNAIKHAAAEKSSAELSIRAKSGVIEIAVRDYGPGIDEAHRKAVYEPLNTLKPRDECEGGGMGLAIVKRIADLYGGDCEIRSNPDGMGVTSVVSIPHSQTC